MAGYGSPLSFEPRGFLFQNSFTASNAYTAGLRRYTFDHVNFGGYAGDLASAFIGYFQFVQINTGIVQGAWNPPGEIAPTGTVMPSPCNILAEASVGAGIKVKRNPILGVFQQFYWYDPQGNYQAQPYFVKGTPIKTGTIVECDICVDPMAIYSVQYGTDSALVPSNADAGRGLPATSVFTNYDVLCDQFYTVQFTQPGSSPAITVTLQFPIGSSTVAPGSRSYIGGYWNQVSGTFNFNYPTTGCANIQGLATQIEGNDSWSTTNPANLAPNNWANVSLYPNFLIWNTAALSYAIAATE